MTKRIGITGPNGFVAQWTLERLRRTQGCVPVLLDRSEWSDSDALDAFVSQCDSIIHLAGMNCGTDQEVEEVNARLAASLVDACRRTDSAPHLVYSSTTKRDENSAYGRGKRVAEATLEAWEKETNGAVTTLVIPNVYGAGCRPFYNSVVATFCQQLTHGEQPNIHEDQEIELLWVGDLAQTLVATALDSKPAQSTLQRLKGEGRLRVSELLSLLEGFRVAYFELDVVPDLTTALKTNLYATFQSHLDPDDHRHHPLLHVDERGSLCEVIKTDAGGQVFFSTTKPGVTRGNHYHTRKLEWFCVVRGQATIRLRRIGQETVYEYRVSGDSPEFVSIPVLHTHSIENVGEGDLLTMFWTNELFDADDSDTFFESVLPDAKLLQHTSAA